MTPQEKAKELIGKFRATEISFWEAKQCALISVEEVIEFMMQDDIENKDCHWANHPKMVYCYKVKEEIEKSLK